MASSRTGNLDALKFAIKQQEGEPLRSTANVVYNEVLLQEDFINDNQDQNLQKVMEEFEGQGEEDQFLEDEVQENSVGGS